jgi:hypothetical protein
MAGATCTLSAFMQHLQSPAYDSPKEAGQAIKALQSDSLPPAPGVSADAVAQALALLRDAAA